MPEFLQLLPPRDALTRLVDHLIIAPKSEEVETVSALGRVTATAVFANQPLPSFDRSTVDGYAVYAMDTHGASETLPAFLKVAGEVKMGEDPGFRLEPGNCALIHTGGMLPGGADAVVMVEHTQPTGGQEIELMRPVAVGENVLKVGEDVARGDEIIRQGTRLRSAEIGGLMALGLMRIQVTGKPVVGILSTGDELVPPHSEIKSGQVRDINSYTLSTLVEEAGGIPRRYGIIPDKIESLSAAMANALVECDMLVVTAGSSASVRDLTAQAIGDLGGPGVLVHGVNVRPGKPTILAACDGKAVIGLPGNPVSALVIAGLFVRPVVGMLLGLREEVKKPGILARLTINLSSQAGREDWVPVRLIEAEDSFEAEPVFSKSNLIFSLARADGLLRIPPDATGLNAGEAAEVVLL
jgi:molybdopterin molybdotransferase